MSKKHFRPAATPQPAKAPVRTCPNGHTVFQQAHHVESRFMVQIPEADGLADICKPSYWAHHAVRVPPKSLLTCIDEHNRWEADLRVLEAGRTFLRVAVVRHVEYDVKTLGDADLEKLRARYTIESNGQNGWRVVDPERNVIVSGKICRADAEAALDAHLQLMNRAVAA